MMRGGMPRLACLLGALAAVCWCAPASAAQAPRIINGDATSAGEYPAQGLLELDTSEGTFVCGGSLVSNRYFLTAGHCATDIDSTTPLPASAFTVKLGKTRKSDFRAADEHGVNQNQVNAQYALTGSDGTVPDHDVALLRLTTPAPAQLEPIRLIEPGETSLWAAGKTATVIGWGVTEHGTLSDTLLEANVPMVSDAYCSGGRVFGSDFDPDTMVCAGGGDTDTCGGDSGGPLMVGDGAFLVLAGLTSWGPDPCAKEGVPGVYTRIGDPDLNAWVRDRVPMARASVSDAAPDPGEEVIFSVTTSHPGIAAFDTFDWDFDSDGTPDAEGATVNHTYPDQANVVARVVASRSGVVDTATDKVALRVGDPPPPPEPTPTPTPTATPAPTAAPGPTPSSTAPRPDGGASQPMPVPVAVASGPLATILVSGRPRVRGGRFPIRVRFAPTAPPRTAVVEVIRNSRVIGVARTKVLRGGTKRLRVKLSPRGRRLLARSPSRRLSLKLRVRVGSQVLRSKRVTVRR
jgi:hypothetical protein